MLCMRQAILCSPGRFAGCCNDMNDNGGKTMKAIHFIAALLIAACAACFHPGPAPAAGAADDPAVPQKGRLYAREKLMDWAIYYNKLQECVVMKIPEIGDDFGVWEPEVMYLCLPQLEALAKNRINVAEWPKNLEWDSSQEENSIRKDAALFDKVHQPIYNFFNFLVSMDRESPERKIMCWYRNMSYWYNDNADKYRDGLKKIDKLIGKYKAAKQNSNMKEMNAAIRDLGEYFYYNVDSGVLTPVNKGAFLYDLDAHSVQFKERRDHARRVMESTMANAKSKHESLQAGLKQLEQIGKESLFYNTASTMPRAMRRVAERAMGTFQVVLEGLEDLSNTSNVFGKLLAQADIGSYSQFTANDKSSYRESIRSALRGTLLNTKEVKHNIRGRI